MAITKLLRALRASLKQVDTDEEGRVTSPDRQIPARYNTETTLGCEVATDAQWASRAFVLPELKGK